MNLSFRAKRGIWSVKLVKPRFFAQDVKQLNSEGTPQKLKEPIKLQHSAFHLASRHFTSDLIPQGEAKRSVKIYSKQFSPSIYVQASIAVRFPSNLFKRWPKPKDNEAESCFNRALAKERELNKIPICSGKPVISNQ